MRDLFIILAIHTKNLSPPELLLRTGPSIISATLVNAGACTLAAIIPVPVLRVFCLQFAVMIVFHGVALLIMFPSLLALQQRCQKANVPCFRPETKTKQTANNNNNTEEVRGFFLFLYFKALVGRNVLMGHLTRSVIYLLIIWFRKYTECFFMMILPIWVWKNLLLSNFNTPQSSSTYSSLSALSYRRFDFYVVIFTLFAAIRRSTEVQLNHSLNFFNHQTFLLLLLVILAFTSNDEISEW